MVIFHWSSEQVHEGNRSESDSRTGTGSSDGGKNTQYRTENHTNNQVESCGATRVTGCCRSPDDARIGSFISANFEKNRHLTRRSRLT
ncbi:hypothetical protein AVEN_140609-1 [Araneus ventricosus]|uniref:Uncharacterized protein n=1 Tax=Araneus ventricosus TaxID=182803 RepID=A0A4Y2N762_ARAVE|nr:hypothetical protein AVEN_140609-1 [Araneus ventricosus]